MNLFTKAEFLKSVGDVGQLIQFYPLEIAVVGKSNVGKSSFINYLCGRKNLAKVGKEPGKTRLINFFGIDDGKFVLVDLPGYGFAKVSDREKIKWGQLIELYLKRSTGLKHIFLLFDLRHDPTEDDRQMIFYLNFYHIDFTVIATKVDKVPKSQQMKYKQNLASKVGVGVDNVFLTSSENRIGKDAICRRIEQIISVSTDTENNE